MAEHPTHPTTLSEDKPTEESKAEEPETTGPAADAFKASGLPASDKKAFEAGFAAATEHRPDLNR